MPHFSSRSKLQVGISPAYPILTCPTSLVEVNYRLHITSISYAHIPLFSSRGTLQAARHQHIHMLIRELAQTDRLRQILRCWANRLYGCSHTGPSPGTLYNAANGFGVLSNWFRLIIKNACSLISLQPLLVLGIRTCSISPNNHYILAFI